MARAPSDNLLERAFLRDGVKNDVRDEAAAELSAEFDNIVRRLRSALEGDMRWPRGGLEFEFVIRLVARYATYLSDTRMKVGEFAGGNDKATVGKEFRRGIGREVGLVCEQEMHLGHCLTRCA